MSASQAEMARIFGGGWHVAATEIFKRLGHIENAGTPVASVTPEFVGQFCFDTTNKALFAATALTSADWAPMGQQAVNVAELAVLDQGDNATNVGAINTTTGLAVTIARLGPFFSLTFTLTAVSITVTDAGASGASGSLKLFDFVQAGVVPLGCRQDYTAFAEGAALTGAAGDAAFVMGLGSVAANAGDGVLTTTEVDFGAVTGTITLSGGTGTGTKFSGAGLNTNAGLDGTTTAIDLYLNWCGTAATIDANSTISVTGTITVTGVLLGDD